MQEIEKLDKENGPVVKIKNLHKSYHGQRVLRGVDLEVKTGSLISIIGRSGCGKTTLLRCLNCLEMFDSGFMEVAGVTLSRKSNIHKRPDTLSKRAKPGKNSPAKIYSVGDLSPLGKDFNQKALAIRKRVGLLFQNLNLFPHLTALENVTKAPIIVNGESKSQASLRAVQLLEKVGLEKFVNRYPNQLSGGQAQRVAIARALAMNPKLMLYDEPTSALDPELVEEVIQVMRNLHKEGMTQIVVTHSMRFARNASDLVAFMDGGSFVEIATPDEIFNNPKDERTRQYLNIFE